MTARILTDLEPYDQLDALRWSALKHMRKSPKHYLAALRAENPNTEPMRMGSALHCAILEPHEFANRYVVYTDSKTTGEGARKKWAAFKEENASKTILDVEDYERTWAMAAAVTSNPDANRLIGAGDETVEAPILWTHTRTGLACKSRLDVFKSDATVVDIKTAANLDRRRFASQAWDLGYFHQAAFYRMAMAALADCNAEEVPFFIIGVESGSPHDCGVFELDRDGLYAAAAEVEKLMDSVVRCKALDKWPGRYQGVNLLEVPAWAIESEDDDFSVEVTRA